MMNELMLWKAAVIGAITASGFLLLVGLYAKLRSPVQQWIASLRMKSLIWKDRRERTRRERKWRTR